MKKDHVGSGEKSLKKDENLKSVLKELADIKYALDQSSIVAITDHRGIIIYANDQFCKITKAERQVAKAANFGLIYGMTAEGLQARVKTQYGMNLSRKEAEAFRRGFFQVYRALRRYHEKQLQKNTIQTLGGRRWTGIPIPPIPGWRNRFNYPVQGTAAEGLKESLPLLLDRLPTHWKLCALVHDEVVVEVPEREADSAQQIVRSALIEGMQKVIPHVPIAVDVVTSKTWVKE